MPIGDAVRRLRAANRARRAEHGAADPLLSVVVPVYKVADYLEETLDSLAAQSLHRFEVIVVDDGSPDDCADIVRRRAQTDPRFRLVRQDNAGPSAARNTGIGSCTAPYLTFVDGDDDLPPHAWELMVRTLERTGSDFCVGKLVRDDGERRFATQRMERNHRERRERLTITAMPEILADVFPVNKVYRRSFWDEQRLAFPEGLFYEDQPVMTRAFLAGTFDVLPETVYHYRIRADRSSTTQLRHELADLRDRMTTKQMTVESIQSYADEGVSRVFFADVLPVDMWEYFRSVPGCTEDYWRLLREGTRELWNDQTLPFEHTVVPVQQRLMGWLVTQDRRADLEQLIALLDRVGIKQLTASGSFAHPWPDDPSVPQECATLP